MKKKKILKDDNLANYYIENTSLDRKDLQRQQGLAEAKTRDLIDEENQK